MITNRDIICLSTIDWSFSRQRHQIFMEFFAQNNNRVIFVEHLGFSAQGIRDISRISRRMIRVSRQKFVKQAGIEKNPAVITPLVLPPGNKMFNLLNNKVFLRILSGRLRKLCKEKPIIWTYSATSTALNLIEQLSPELIIYDCVCDVLRHPEAPADIASTERELLELADIVFADARYFYNLKKEYHANIYQVPPGVDFTHFNAPDNSNKKILSTMQKIKRPRICSFGGIDSIRIDLDLIDFISRKRPQWSIVMIGPMRHIKIPSTLLSRHNIIWLGAKSYEELPAYLSQCDVLILAYKLNAFTQSIFPAKTFECLASGKPTVSTALPELTPFKDLITIANDTSGFLEGIEKACGEDSEENKKQRVSFAKNNSWQSRFNLICEKMESKLTK